MCFCGVMWEDDTNDDAFAQKGDGTGFRKTAGFKIVYDDDGNIIDFREIGKVNEAFQDADLNALQDGDGEETKESDRKARQVMISRLTKIIPIRNQAQMGLIKNADVKDLDAAAAANYDVILIDRA